MGLALAFDLDGLDGLITDSELVLSVYLMTLSIVIGFVVAFECVERLKRRSPVEKLLRKRFG